MSTAATKRPRAPSSPTHISSTETTDLPSKASRIAPSSSYDTSSSSGSTVKPARTTPNISARPLLCNLPPTCNLHPTPIADTNELERHYATYHAHVCEDKGCGCVFPDARLLELHQAECHNPIAALNKERGQKIFQCHLPHPTCGRYFMTPKARRLHLIQAHSFPKEYFFAVTNKGIGGLLKKWGEGASMVRKEWKPREGQNARSGKGNRGQQSDEMDDDDDDEDDDDEDEDEDVELERGDKNQEDEEEEAGDLEATPRMLPRTTGVHSSQSSISSFTKGHIHRNAADHAGVEGLINSFDSLSLVPNSIRFGRGAKTGGFAANVRGGRGRGRARGAAVSAGRGGLPGSAGKMDVDRTGPGSAVNEQGHGAVLDGQGNAPQTQDGVPRGRGRGRARPRRRGRGRGL